MLSAAFFISVFSSIVWLFYAFSNISGGKIEQFAITVAVIVLPVLVLWVVFGYLYQYFSTSVLNKNMYTLFKQMNKNQEYADVMVKILLESRENFKDGIVLNKFDVFISDMNELLSEIIERGKLSSPEQIDNLWIKVKNGGKWAFGKVLIDIYQNQPNLPKILLEESLKDIVLGGTILEFCSRYQNLINTLEKHDQERIFLNVIETGVYGKVFSLLAGPADSIRQNRDLSIVHKQMNESENAELTEDYLVQNDEEDTTEKKQPLNASTTEKTEKKTLTEDARQMFLNTFTRKKPATEENTDVQSTDPLTMAFAKSFGAKSETEFKEEEKEEYSLPVEETTEETIPEDDLDEIKTQEINSPQEETETMEEPDQKQMPEIIIEEKALSEIYAPAPSVITPELENGFNNTQDQLSNLKKEWEDAKQRDLSARKDPVFEKENEGMPEPKINRDEDYSYPFGEWMNVENYNK